jgi:hypothetical protein
MEVEREIPNYIRPDPNRHHYGRYLVFQLAEVAVPRALFTQILRRIDQLRGPPMPAM